MANNLYISAIEAESSKITLSSADIEAARSIKPAT